jgi:uncharacterized membrane protein YgcG
VRGYVRRVLAWLGIALFFFLTLVLPLAGAFAPSMFPKFFASKYYDFPDVTIDATVHPDGSMSVVERRTFDFSKGDFSFAYREIHHRQPGDIMGFSVTEGTTRYVPWDPFGSGSPLDPGVLAISDNDDTLRGTWYFHAHDERRTFTIRYSAMCAVNVYPDGAHLYWQFIPDGFDKPTAHARVTIHLPGNADPAAAEGIRPASACTPQDAPLGTVELPTTPLLRTQVRAWAHGPPQGEISLPNPQTIVLDVRNLQPFRFVEGSVLFPRGAVPLEGPTPSGFGPDATAGPVHTAADVLRQEVKLADETNAVRRRLHVFDVLWRSLAVAYPVVVVAMVIVARRGDLVPGVPRDTQDIPETMHPVDLAVLWGSWHHGLETVQNAYRAELLWLAQQGTIEIQADGRVTDPKDLKILLKDLPSHPLDEEFTQYLFGSDGVGPLALSSIKPTGERATELRAWMHDVNERIGRQTARRHHRPEARVLFWGMLALIVAGILSAIELHRSSVAWVVAEALVVWGVGRWFLPPRLPDATRERLARWAAFRRFLRRFSSLPDAPTLAVVIWEKYLVYATALGVAHRVAKQVKALVPEERLPSAWAGAPSGIDGFRRASSIATAAPVALGVSGSSSGGSTWSGGSGSSSSSSGFGGGGFSGGGGGGGGQGGGGAG